MEKKEEENKSSPGLESQDIIASTYEIKIERKLGEGGGGIVYLAWHSQLKKHVVVKVGKKRVSHRSDSVRREVDVLKDLKHQYISRVYDYFEKDDTVYTVIDYIEGESLNIPLSENKSFSQPQVIKWAIQLLEALSYLHSPTHGDPPRGFVHGDIKPANIMLTPRGDICLIDFNISLALGEENAVGYTRGYASPEHYGQDYSSVTVTSVTGTSQTAGRRRRTARTAGSSSITPASSGGSSGGKKILPDVRSDIYSLGATLYHLLSGERPKENAMEVEPLSEKKFSPQIVRIIAKAMNPNPNYRYQTAEEMLDDFLHLRERDERVVRWKRRNIAVYASLFVLLLAGAGMSFVGLKRMQVKEEWLKLSEYSQSALQEGDLAAAIDYALETFPEEKGILVPDPIPEGQRALTAAAGVYDLSDGYRARGTVELPSEPLYLQISPDGRTAASLCAWNVVVFDTESFEILAELPSEPSALAEVVFMDNDRILYGGEKGLTAYDLREKKELWTGNPATGIALSGDGSRAAGIYKDEGFATLYDTTDGTVLGNVDFQGKHQWTAVNDIYANPENSIFSLNEDGSLLGVSFLDGSLCLFRTGEESSVTVCDETSGFDHYEGGFYKNYLAFSAGGSSGSAVVIIDGENMEQLAGLMDDQLSYTVQADEKGIYILQGGEIIQYDPATGEVFSLADTSENMVDFHTDGVHTLVTTDQEFQIYDRNEVLLESGKKTTPSELIRIGEGTALLGSLDSPAVRVLNYENHQESEIFSYDPLSWDHDEARWSQDRQSIMLFTYKQFRIYDLMGHVIAEVSIPDAEQVYDTQYVRDSEGTRLEVIYNDGRILWYDGGDGTLLSEEQGEAPDPTLLEEFETDDWRIESPLHGSPLVYELDSGKQVATLREDADLTYVTQIPEGLVVQYLSEDGSRYGQLLDENFKVVADLPYLCDVVDGTLLFDYPTGDIRQSRVIPVEEIKETARQERGVLQDEESE